MKKSIACMMLVGLLTACGDTTNIPTPNPAPFSPTAQDYSGLYYFDNGGRVRLTPDPDNKVDIGTTTIYLFNADDGFTAFTIPVNLAVDVVDKKLTTTQAVVTATAVGTLRVNVGNPVLTNSSLLPTVAPNNYRSNQTFELAEDGSLSVTVNIYHAATATSPFYLVYKSTITSY